MVLPCSIALAFTLAGQPSARADGSVDVTLRDKGMESMSAELSTAEVKAGSITFNITNASQELIHELVVIRSDLAINAVPYADEQDNEVDEDKMNVIGEAEDIEPGKSQTLTLTLEPGQYLLMCNLPGHYKAGMEATLKVVP